MAFEWTDHDLEARRREAERPLREAGEGEAEGFEESERELIEQAENPEAGRNPKYDAGRPEAEADPAEYGEADEIHSSERPDDY
ncbi:MAG: hypothetical protein J0H98_06195 [Solirubrobacterales bacterium]|nr:hypothetical protein [Solirubrobacterales bacterium]